MALKSSGVGADVGAYVGTGVGADVASGVGTGVGASVAKPIASAFSICKNLPVSLSWLPVAGNGAWVVRI